MKSNQVCILGILSAADRFRVLLKGEHPDYIHAVFAHVSSEGLYSELRGEGGDRGVQKRD